MTPTEQIEQSGYCAAWDCYAPADSPYWPHEGLKHREWLKGYRRGRAEMREVAQQQEKG